MPIQEGVLIAYKAGVVEMTATVIDPHEDEAEAFTHAVNARIFDHQYQAMTDPAILNPINLALASCVLSRDPLGAGLKDGLISLAFAPIDTEAGAAEEHSMFTRFQKPRRSKLEKWRTMYLRASDVSTRLASFEESMTEDMPAGKASEITEEGSEALIRAARTHLKLLLAPNFEGIGQLERTLLQERSQKKGRLVLHPAIVRGITCFIAQTLMATAPLTSWSGADSEELALLVQAPKGDVVRSDPEFRVVNFVNKGSKETLTAYIETVLRQSLTSALQS